MTTHTNSYEVRWRVATRFGKIIASGNHTSHYATADEAAGSARRYAEDNSVPHVEWDEITVLVGNEVSRWTRHGGVWVRSEEVLLYALLERRRRSVQNGEPISPDIYQWDLVRDETIIAAGDVARSARATARECLDDLDVEAEEGDVFRVLCPEGLHQWSRCRGEWVGIEGTP